MVSQLVQKCILMFFMFLNCFITPGGVIYGWPGLAQLLKDEGEYSQGCENYDPKKTCGDQDNKLSNIFTVGANVATVSTIVFGFTLDRWGVRSNAFAGAMLMTAGFLLFGFSTTLGDHPFDAFIPGFALIAFGGLGTYLPAFQFSFLFNRPTRILSIQGALFGMAGLTFTFFKFLAEQHGISRKTSFLAYAMLTAFCGLNMLLLYPKNNYKPGDLIHLPVLGWLGIQKPPVNPLDSHLNVGTDYSPLDDDSEDLRRSGSKMDVLGKDHVLDAGRDRDIESSNGMSSPAEDGLMIPPPPSSTAPIPYTQSEIEMLKQERIIRDLTPAEKTAVLNSRSLKDEIFYPGTYLVASFFAIGLLCSNLYQANVGTLLKHMGDSDGKFADAFVFVTSLFPMVFSLAIDALQKRYRYAGTSFLAITFLIIATAFLYIDNPYSQIPAWFILAMGKSLLITVMFSFVAVEYRGDHYGRVIAFVTACTAAVGLLQLALQKILAGPAHNEFDYFSTGMIIALTFTYRFPYWCHKNRV